MAWLWVDQSRRRTKDTKDSKEGPRCLRALFFFFSWGMSGTSESKDDWRLCIVEARDCLFWARLEF